MADAGREEGRRPGASLVTGGAERALCEPQTSGEGQAWGSAPWRLTVGLSGPVFIFSGPGLMRSL